MKSSRDENEGAYRNGEGGGRACLVAPDLSHAQGGRRRNTKCEYDGWGKQKQKDERNKNVLDFVCKVSCITTVLLLRTRYM